MIRSYQELIQFPTLEERFRYLSIKGSVGEDTFGHERELNQMLYHSREWKDVRYEVIARDLSCDLGVEGYEIHSPPYVHHMNPLTPSDILDWNPDNLNPEYLITCSLRTHNAIHYGDERHLPRPLIERRPGDTKLW